MLKTKMMMKVTLLEGKDIVQNFERAKAGIMRTSIKSVKGATLAGQRFARRIAPVATGALKAGIIRRPVMRKGKQVSSVLISKVDKPFPYQKWVNTNIKYVTLPTRRTRYGTWPTSSTRTKWARKGLMRRWRYAQTKHTGLPGYFNLTADYLSKVFPQMAVQKLKSELKIAFTK